MQIRLNHFPKLFRRLDKVLPLPRVSPMPTATSREKKTLFINGIEIHLD